MISFQEIDGIIDVFDSICLNFEDFIKLKELKYSRLHEIVDNTRYKIYADPTIPIGNCFISGINKIISLEKAVQLSKLKNFL